MFNFLRKLRLKNLNGKYFKYALGEIILVVIGILIALSINNLNENRKQKERQKQYLIALISELKTDLIDLAERNRIDSIEILQIETFNSRMSDPRATMDTVRKIARYEFAPYFDPSNELNRNTMQALSATGEIGQFPKELRDLILKHDSEQISSLKIMDANVEIFLATMERTALGPSSHPASQAYGINGKLQDEIWDSMDDQEIARKVTSRITSKLIMLKFISRVRQRLILNTQLLLFKLEADFEKYYP